MLQGPEPTIRPARALRKDMSLPERLLWRALRGRPGGFKFRRQHPAGPYIADFFCHDARLVVEIDGEAHALGDRPARDRRRDAWFADRGFDVLRVPAADVLDDLHAALQAIVTRARCGARKPNDPSHSRLTAMRRLLAPASSPLRQALPGAFSFGGGSVLE
jgi:very-short-patch-repair endonuclease